MATDEVKTTEETKSPDPATCGLIYAPVGSRRRRTHKPRPLVAYRKPENQSATPTEAKSEDSIDTLDLDEAFQYRIDDGRNYERAVRAASFLLDWATAEGNEQVDPVLVQGISRALNLAADNMARDFRRRSREQQEQREV